MSLGLLPCRLLPSYMTCVCNLYYVIVRVCHNSLYRYELNLSHTLHRDVSPSADREVRHGSAATEHAY